MEVRALMKVLIGVDPHKASLAVAAVDEATGELVELASFPQNRVGLRCLERWAKRFPERRWAVENAGGLGRHLAVRLATAQASRWWTCRRSFRRGCGCSRPAMPARMTGSMPSQPRLAASRNGRLAAVDPEAASEVLRLLSERRLLTW